MGGEGVNNVARVKIGALKHSHEEAAFKFDIPLSATLLSFDSFCFATAKTIVLRFHSMDDDDEMWLK